MSEVYACLEKLIDHCEIRNQFLSPLVLIYYSILCLSLYTKHFKSSNHTTACVTFYQNSCSSQYKQAYFNNKAAKPHCILSVCTKVTNLKFSFKEKKINLQ